jgi:phospholipid transport system substrate-binding protein
MKNMRLGRSDVVPTIRPLRLVLAAFLLAIGIAGLARPAQAAPPAEQFISENVQKGLTILNNKQISKEQRRAEFRDFLLGLTDIKSIADYTLGQYRRTASPEALADYEGAFKEYALAVYQGYFSKYTGQSLQVTGSYPLGSDETVVKTVMVDPKQSSSKPLAVNFRVLDRGGHMLVADFSVEGVWIRELERNDFTSFLGQNNGNIGLLTQNLKNKAQLNR